MKIYLRLFVFVLLAYGCQSKQHTTQFDFTTSFERSGGMETATYKEIIQFYENLANTYPSIALYEMGPTDSGEPLHVVAFNSEGISFGEFTKPMEKNVLLINNGIHPGESDGIDATMMLMRDYAKGKLTPPKNTVITAIPIYNIGGALNRNSGTRTNQNGPKEYGFRGNARNFDLNRDFIKTDTKNAKSFQELFHKIDPEAFIDNHVSNGADYQYTLTHLFTQHNKMGGAMGTFLYNEFQPALEDSISKKGWDITPYVNVFNRTPDQGFSQFMDYPRYSSGYTTLFNTLGMMVETHMLKPYKQRVEGTYEWMVSFINVMDEQATTIRTLRDNASESYEPGNKYPLQWQVDSSKTTNLKFKGYEGRMIESDLTGAQRLKYFRDKPYEKDITYYNHFKATKEIIIPSYYVIPQGQWPVIESLQNNSIEMTTLEKDTLIKVEVYHIVDYQTFNRAYEGHYPHYDTEVSVTLEKVAFRKGDYLVSTQQKGVRFLLETLEPSSIDSFFNWNYFDAILQQKEGFSPYVWEDKAKELLQQQPELSKRFEAKKKSESDFNSNWFSQLDWIHKQSTHYETSHLRYPIVRMR